MFIGQQYYKFELGSKNFVFFILAYLSGGIIISIATALHLEDLPSQDVASNRDNVLGQPLGVTLGQRLWTTTGQGLWLALGQGLWAAVVGILTMCLTNNGLYVSLALFSILVFLLVLTLVIPFFKEKNDLAFWNFSIKTVLGFLSSYLLFLVLFAGFGLLLLSLDKLFGVKITEHIYFDAAITMCFLSLLVFLQMIPSGKDKFIREPKCPSRGFTKIIHYLLIPLVVAYIAVLFVYGASIIKDWTLPNGWVSVSVMISFISMLIVVFLEFPIKFRSEKENAFDKKIMRILPAAVLPLLILMSVAIGRRVMDYGVTIQRLYAILFNIWSYAICIGLIFFSEKRIRWTFASFAIAFLLVSAGPVNVCSITKNKLLKEINMVCSSEELVSNQVLINKAVSKYKYLKRKFGDEEIDKLISEDFRSILNSKIEKMEHKSVKISNSYVDVPQGAKQAVAFYLNVSNIDPDAEFSDAFIEYTIFDELDSQPKADTHPETTSPVESKKRIKCKIPVRQLIELSKKERTPPVRIECEGGVAYLTEYCSLYFEPQKGRLEIDTSGLLFLN